MGVQDRNDIPDNITFFRLAEATNVPGEHGVSEAHLIVIHSMQRIQTDLEVQGGQGKQK